MIRKFKKTVGILLCLFCLVNAAEASSSIDIGFDRVDINGAEVTENSVVNVVAGDTISVRVHAEKDTTDWQIIPAQRDSYLTVGEPVYSGQECTMRVNFYEGIYGRTDWTLDLYDQGDYNSQYSLVFNVVTPQEVEVEPDFIGLNPENAPDSIRFCAATGLSPEWERNLQLKYSWEIWENGRIVRSFAGKDQKLSLDRGDYDVELTVTDRLGRVFSKTTNIKVLEGEGSEAWIDYSQSDDTSLVGELYQVNLNGSYAAHNVKYWVYIDEDNPRVLPYKAGARNDLTTVTRFDTPGTKTITIVVREEFSDGERVGSHDGELARQKYTVFVEYPQKETTQEEYNQQAAVTAQERNIPVATGTGSETNPCPGLSGLTMIGVVLLTYKKIKRP